MKEENKKLLNDLIDKAVDERLSNSALATIKITPTEVKYHGPDVYVESLAARMERMERERIEGRLAIVKSNNHHDMAINLINILAPCLVMALIALAIVNAVRDSQNQLRQPQTQIQQVR